VCGTPYPAEGSKSIFVLQSEKGERAEEARDEGETFNASYQLSSPISAVEVDPKRRENEDAGAAGPKVGKPLNDF
jgi:hypothetical protein